MDEIGMKVARVGGGGVQSSVSRPGRDLGWTQTSAEESAAVLGMRRTSRGGDSTARLDDWQPISWSQPLGKPPKARPLPPTPGSVISFHLHLRLRRAFTYISISAGWKTS